MPLCGQDEHPDTAVKDHLPLIWKIISLDRNAKEDMGSHIRVGILFQKKNRVSVLNKESIVRLVEQRNRENPNSPSIHVTPIEITDTSLLENQLKTAEVNVLYITPLRGTAIEDIVHVTRSHGIRSFTGTASYVEEGVAVGFGIKGDGLQIIINLKASRNEGADYPLNVLRLAKVIK